MTASSTIDAVTARAGRLGRSGGHKAMRGLQEVTRLATRWTGYDDVTSLAMWPAVTTGAELADLSARLRWFIDPACEVLIPVEHEALEPIPVDWFPEASQRLPDNVRLVPTGEIPKADAVAVWKHARRTLISPTSLRAFADAVVVDPWYFDLTEVGTYGTLAIRTEPQDPLDVDHPNPSNVFASFLASVHGAERAIVYGTGPSMTAISPEDAGADVVIACNSAVRDPEWIAATRPNVIAFADPVFHFGPSRYAAQFREDLVAAVESSGSYMATLTTFAPLVRRHLPELLERTILLSPGREGFTVPSPTDLSVPSTENILTMLMLPLAGAIGSSVAVAGCDGRAPGEKRFWRHSSVGQYPDELMATVAAAHPSFFRDRSYADYYDEHCEILDRQVTALEARGVDVSSVTHSMIPALATRAR